MTAEFWFWALCSLLAAALIVCQSFCLLELLEAANDHINLHQLSERVRKVFLPEHFVQLTLFVLLLLSSRWIYAALQLPLAIHHVYQLKGRRKLMYHIFGTNEFKRSLRTKKLACAVKLIFYTIMFVSSIVGLIITAVSHAEASGGGKDFFSQILHFHQHFEPSAGPPVALKQMARREESA